MVIEQLYDFIIFQKSHYLLSILNYSESASKGVFEKARLGFEQSGADKYGLVVLFDDHFFMIPFNDPEGTRFCISIFI